MERDERKEDGDDCGLPWVAISNLESCRALCRFPSGNLNFPPATQAGKGLTLSSWKSLPRRARMPFMDVGNKTLRVSEAASPIFGLEVHCL